MGEDGKNLKDRTEELMSKKELNSKISRKKAELQPILKELKQLREDIDVIDFVIVFVFGQYSSDFTCTVLFMLK
jgi:hypothetical protein